MSGDQDEIWQRIQQKLAAADPATQTRSRWGSRRIRRRTAIAGAAFTAAAALAIGAAGSAAVVATITPAPTLVNGPAGTFPRVNTAIGGDAPAIGAPTQMDTAKASYIGGYLPGGQPVLEPAANLPNTPGNVPGYQVTAAGVNMPAYLQRLADTFSITGTPGQSSGSWTVGSSDGTGPALWLSGDGVGSWSFSDPTRNPWACGPVPMSAGTSPVAEGSGGPSATTPGTTPDTPCVPTPPLRENQAIKRSQETLATLGSRTTPVEWESSTDNYTTTVTGWPLVDGQRLPLAWTFTYDAEGLLSANGYAGTVQPTDPYQTVGAKDAVERSHLLQWSAFGPTMDYTNTQPIDPGISTVGGSRPATSDASRTTSTRPQIPVTTLTVNTAEPTLAPYWQPNGTLLLLPGYRLTTGRAIDGTYVVIAIAESEVAFVTPQPMDVMPMAREATTAHAIP